MRALGVVAALVLLAGCGTETDDPQPRADETPIATPTAMPTEIPAASGPVRTAYAITVLDDGDGAELCLGGVAESFPPQCGGPKLLGWDWAEHDGDFEDAGGTRWGEFAVTGSFDGTDLTVTDAVPSAELDSPSFEDPDFSTPCPEPDGGWPEPDNSSQDTDQAFRRAQLLDDYAGSWVDTSPDPRSPEQMDQDAVDGNHDASTWIVNVQVTGDVATAEAAIREVWDGPLCVTRAERTERELRRIQDEVFDLPGTVSSDSGFDKVNISVFYDDGSIQAWADQEYGEGVVVVTSALVLAE